MVSRIVSEMFKLLIAFLAFILAINAYNAPVLFNFQGARPRPINDREFLRFVALEVTSALVCSS